MIVDGYGKVLVSPGARPRTRELCIVAACAAAGRSASCTRTCTARSMSGALPTRSRPRSRRCTTSSTKKIFHVIAASRARADKASSTSREGEGQCSLIA